MAVSITDNVRIREDVGVKEKSASEVAGDLMDVIEPRHGKISIGELHENCGLSWLDVMALMNEYGAKMINKVSGMVNETFPEYSPKKEKIDFISGTTMQNYISKEPKIPTIMKEE